MYPIRENIVQDYSCPASIGLVPLQISINLFHHIVVRQLCLTRLLISVVLIRAERNKSPLVVCVCGQEVVLIDMRVPGSRLVCIYSCDYLHLFFASSLHLIYTNYKQCLLLKNLSTSTLLPIPLQ